MIIRLTVNDNDYSTYLERFAEGLLSRLNNLPNILPDDTLVGDKLKAHKDWERTFDLINPNTTTADNITEEDKQFMCDRVRKAFEFYLSKSFTKAIDAEETREYLALHFECSVGYDFKDMWENGEAVYYFTKANTTISQ